MASVSFPSLPTVQTSVYSAGLSVISSPNYYWRNWTASFPIENYPRLRHVIQNTLPFLALLYPNAGKWISYASSISNLTIHTKRLVDNTRAFRAYSQRHDRTPAQFDLLAANATREYRPAIKAAAELAATFFFGLSRGLIMHTLFEIGESIEVLSTKVTSPHYKAIVIGHIFANTLYIAALAQSSLYLMGIAAGFRAVLCLNNAYNCFKTNKPWLDSNTAYMVSSLALAGILGLKAHSVYQAS